MFGLFKKHCPVCGTDVDEKAVKRFGKYFDSENHSEEYRKKMAQEESRNASKKGGCC